MKKIGDNILLASLAAVSLYVVYRLNKSRNDFKPEADFYQLSNRFIEFFDTESIQEAYRKYSEYVGMGLSPQSAFEMTIDEK